MSQVHYSDIEFSQLVQDARYIFVAEFVSESKRTDKKRSYSFDLFKVRETLKAPEKEVLGKKAQINVWAAHANLWGQSMRSLRERGESFSPIINRFKHSPGLKLKPGDKAILFLNQLNQKLNDYEYSAEGAALKISAKNRILKELKKSTSDEI